MSSLPSCTPSRRSPLRGAVLFALTSVIAAACGYKHDPDTYFSEDWESSYDIVADCDKTLHPRGGHMEVWLSPEATEAFAAGEPLPAGAVLVKPQWDKSSSCSKDPDLYTVMRAKAGGGWDWQTIGGKGDIQDTDAESCSSCHAACGESLVCTKP